MQKSPEANFSDVVRNRESEKLDVYLPSGKKIERVTGKIEIRKNEGDTGFIITNGKISHRFNDFHNIDYLLFADIFQVPPKEILLSKLSCPDYNPERLVKNDFFDGSQFEPKLVGEKIMEIETFLTAEDSQEIFVWRDGYYQPRGKTTIEQYTKFFLQKEFRKHRLSEIKAYIHASTLTTINEPSTTLLNLENGVLNLKTLELTPHTPELHFFQNLPVKYDPSCENTDAYEFFRQITGCEEDTSVLEELAGYCLLREYPFHKALMFVGDGANGKSTFLKLVKALLGSKNVSSRSLFELEINRFAKADLFGKLANIYPDLPDQALRQTGIFKMLTGGDTIEAEKKFRNSFSFINYAKLLFSANKVPEVKDDTNAFFLRWIIVMFPNKFEEANRDPYLLEKLTTPTALSGFLNLAVTGLTRICNNGGFTYNKTTGEIREDYVRKSDPLAAFVMDCIEHDTDNEIIKQELFSYFGMYCRRHNLPCVSSDTFFKNLPQHVSITPIRLNRRDIPGRPSAFKGIRYTKVGESLHRESTQSSQSTVSDILSKYSPLQITKIEKPPDYSDCLDPPELMVNANVFEDSQKSSFTKGGGGSD